MPAKTDTTRIFRQNGAIFSTPLGDEIALLSVQRGRYYGLNPMASEIWKRLANPLSMGELTGSMIRDYRGDPQRIEAEVEELLRRLTEEGLIEAQR